MKINTVVLYIFVSFAFYLVGITNANADQGSVSPIQIGLSGLFAFGGSSEENKILENLQAGGHDPNQNGFTIQNVELSLGSVVDPYFDAQTNIVFQIDSEGATIVELEEAFFTTRALPWGLQVKGGQFFTEFGRQNRKHPHTWFFADQPVILTRLFGGDGLRSQGVRASLFIPVSWYSEVYLSAQNAKGETALSFLYVEDEEIGGHALQSRDARNLSDLIYMARWLNGLDLSDTISVNIGVSSLWGPNSSGESTGTAIHGADLYIKWQPAYTQRGFPFISWHTEILSRRYEAGDSGDPTHETLKDQGMFTQAVWGFMPGWASGLRLERATADGDTSRDPMRDTRDRLSINLTWYPTEFSKLRTQFNFDQAEHLPENSARSLWLQLEFSIGSHMAHKF